MSRGTFVTVRCDGCGNEQVVFSNPAGDVDCVVCGDRVAESTGGRAEFLCPVIEEVE